jgi:AraC-like DNA-binding protein
MKPLVQKLPLSQDSSFVARTYRTPNYEVPWHQHIEYELILFTEGEGMSFVGNYVGEYKTGDVFFLGSNLPHMFPQKDGLIASAVVVQFKEEIFGKEFMNLPESREIRELFSTSAKGLKLRGNSRALLQNLIKELEYVTGFKKMLILCQCLYTIAYEDDFDTLSTQDIKPLNSKDKGRIDKIFQHTIDNFQQAISLTDVAEKIGMSVPAFCNYFKKSTKKTYATFVNEIRIGYACKFLIDTDANVIEVCYKSGFNTLTNFNKQFLKVKGTTPSDYRKSFKNNTPVSSSVNALYLHK